MEVYRLYDLVVLLKREVDIYNVIMKIPCRTKFYQVYKVVEVCLTWHT